MNIGLIGLGVMGENLALNLVGHGFGVTGYDLDSAKRERFEKRTQGLRAQTARSISQLVDSLETPRRLWLMVPAGAAVDHLLAELRPLLSPGDVVMDGGNTLFTDTQRRIQSLEGSGVLFVGVGVSGGEEGALRGPSLMPGGSAEAWPLVQPLLQAISAKTTDGKPCCEWMGSGGAGHFVKMVHNGIEYADMQTICEAYSLMHQTLGMSAIEISAVFEDWNNSELGSYLMGITADILAHTDPESGMALVDLILDTAEQKGTGKWASQVALDLGVTAPTIATAVFARTVSALKSERVVASQILTGPTDTFTQEKPVVLEKIRRALLGAKICAYAQGFSLLKAADREHQWQLSFATIASVWRAGCIIRASLLSDICSAYERTPELTNLLIDPQFSKWMGESQQALREVVSIAALNGAAVPSFMSALSYYDAYRSARLPANLLQAQRDYFGAHTYQRVDRPGKFHTQWQKRD